MKKLALLLLLPLVFISCLKEGTDYVHYTGYIDVDVMTMQDTAVVGSNVPITVRGGAPNGCWSNLEIIMTKQRDTLYSIAGIGLFETTNGVCDDQVILVDSVIIFKPTVAGKYRFIAESPYSEMIKDSLIVIPAPVK